MSDAASLSFCSSGEKREKQVVSSCKEIRFCANSVPKQQKYLDQNSIEQKIISFFKLCQTLSLSLCSDTLRKYHGVKTFHLLAHLGCHRKIMVISPFKLEMSYYHPSKHNKR